MAERFWNTLKAFFPYESDPDRDLGYQAPVSPTLVVLAVLSFFYFFV